MKKILLSAAALLFGTAAAFAQSKKSTVASHISLGPVVSFGHSWTSNVGDRPDFKASPALGIGMVYSKNEHWGLGAQLLVSHEGYKQDVPVGGGNYVKMTVNPVYLRLPLQATYFFGDYGDRIRPKVYAGPSVAVRVDETHYYSNDNYRPAEGSTAASDRFNRMDFGLTAGAGVNIRVSRLTWLNLDAGYYHGLVDAVANNFDNDFNGNRSLRLNAGLMWGL